MKKTQMLDQNVAEITPTAEEKQITKTQTPTDLIQLAIQHGSDLEKLEKILSIQERYEANEARKAYHQSMARFKSDPPKIYKDRNVGYDSKQGGRVGYTHASLGNVTEKISVALSEQGLSASWTTKQNGQIIVTCRITHKLGHSEETSLSAPADATGAKNSIQAIGSTVTYLSRYTLLSLCGLATYDQDDDGQAAATEYITGKQLSQLLDLVADREVNEEKFLEYMKIDSLEKMPASKFQQALAAIQAKKTSKQRSIKC